MYAVHGDVHNQTGNSCLQLVDFSDSVMSSFYAWSSIVI